MLRPATTCDPSACGDAQERNGGARGLTLGLLREERVQCTSCASADLSQSSVHLHCIDGALLNPRWRILMLGVARKLTLRAPGGSETLSSYMHRRSARARRIYACRSSRKKRPHRSALCIRRRPCRWVASTELMFGVARKLTLRASGRSETPSSYTQTQRSC